MDLTVPVFVLVYLSMAMGHLPGFRVDRTGAAIVGAMVLIATDQITPAAAWQAVDYRAIGLLFGLMIISAAFLVSGFYDRVAKTVGNLSLGPKGLLAVLIVVASVLSSLMNKDVVAVAMAPLLCSICISRRLNPVPFLLAFCFAANFSSALTLIGAPQYMIVAEALNLSFVGFTRGTAPPILVALPAIWVVIVFIYRGRWQLRGDPPSEPAGSAEPVAFDPIETIKAAVVATAVIAAFIFTDWPHMLIALFGASALLLSRRITSEKLIHHVNGDLLLLLFGLFVVNAALIETDIPQRVLESLRSAGLDLHDPPSLLAVMAVLSNIIGNNPAVMLIIPLIGKAPNPEALGTAIALGTAFASSAMVYGSLVGIIIAEECNHRGIKLGFGEFARAGIPTALIGLVIGMFWIIHLR